MRLIANLILFIASLGLMRVAAAYHLGVDFTRFEGGVAAFVASCFGIALWFVPKEQQQRVGEGASRVLGNHLASILVGTLFFVASAASAVTTYTVQWTGPDTLVATINGREEQIRGAPNDQGMMSVRLRSLAFTEQHFSIASYERVFRLAPFEAAELDVPLHITAPRTPRIVSVESTLLGAFYQYFEEQRLNEAAAALQALQPSTSGERAAAERLDSVFRALQLVFSGRESSALLIAQLEDYRAQYPGDPWPKLIEAAARVRAREFSHAIELLDEDVLTDATRSATPEFVATVHFLRATAELKQAPLESSNGVERMFNAAMTDFAAAEHLLAATAESPFKQIAYPNSIIFQGITEFYRGRMDEAGAQFMRATELAQGPLKARAFNSAGFIEFIAGHLDRAEALLIQSLSADPGFPYARSNLGFVLMARGNYARARTFFESNANDPVLQQTSRRDVLLAELSLTHLADLQGEPLESSNNGYARSLASVGKNDFASVEEPELRFALLAREVANQIYLSGQYYGLEVFALNMLCRGQQVLASSPLSDERVQQTRAAIAADVRTTRARVNPSWLDGSRTGWFQALNGC